MSEQLTRDDVKSAVCEAMRDHAPLTRDEVRDIVRETVTQITHREDLESLATDLRYVSEWRQTTDTIKHKGIVAAVGLAVTGAAGLVVLGVREWLRG